VYRTDYEDLQVSIFDGGLGFNVGNAAEAKVEGVELDGRWRAAEWLTLSGSAAYLDVEFEDYDNGECYFRQEQLEPSTVTSPTTCSFSGERQVYTPEWTASAAADFVFPISGSLEFKATIDLNYYDDYLVSPSLDPRIEQDAFTKVGSRIAVAATNGDWEIALIGKNLTDEVVTTYAAEIPASSTLVAGATGGQQGLAYYGFFDRPRSVALQGTSNF
jgi:outer membrane receptor protein involved in Fe transport